MINPNGAWMDIVRTPYQRHAWLDPEQTFRVRLRWYPAPPGAKAYPGHHLFSSADWCAQDPHYPWPGPGEDKASRRTFYAGEGPRRHYAGQTPIGNPQWYQTGVPLDVIRAALANPPPPPADYSANGYPYPAFVICGQQKCPGGGSRMVGFPEPLGGWRWGGYTIRCHINTRVQSVGGWRWGGGTASSRPQTQAGSRGGWRWGGSTTMCKRRMMLLSEGDWMWGGFTVRNPYPPPYASRGGWKWGGSTAWCRPHSPAALTAGGWKWGGSTTSTRPSPFEDATAGGWKWGGSTASTTLVDCGTGGCTDALGCCVPTMLYALACARKAPETLTDPPTLIPLCSAPCAALTYNGNPSDPHWLGTLLLNNGDTLNIDLYPDPIGGRWLINTSGCITNTYGSDLSRCDPFCIAFLPFLRTIEGDGCCGADGYQDTIILVQPTCPAACTVDADARCLS